MPDEEKETAMWPQKLFLVILWAVVLVVSDWGVRMVSSYFPGFWPPRLPAIWWPWSSLVCGAALSVFGLPPLARYIVPGWGKRRRRSSRTAAAVTPTVPAPARPPALERLILAFLIWFSMGTARALVGLFQVVYIATAIAVWFIPLAGWFLGSVMLLGYFLVRALVRGFFPRP